MATVTRVEEESADGTTSIQDALVMRETDVFNNGFDPVQLPFGTAVDMLDVGLPRGANLQRLRVAANRQHSRGTAVARNMNHNRIDLIGAMHPRSNLLQTRRRCCSDHGTLLLASHRVETAPHNRKFAYE